MILSDNSIKSRIDNYDKYAEVYSGRKSKPLIEGFNTDNLQSASYDATIENTIRRFRGSNKAKKIHLDKKDEIDGLFEEVDISNGYDLEPNEYILIRLKELVNMPDDLVGHIRPRTTLTKLGLMLSNQHINPSYSGQLQLGLYNPTPITIKIIPGLKIGQLIFEQIDKEVNKDNLYYRKKDAKYQNETEFTGSRVYDEVSLLTEMFK